MKVNGQKWLVLGLGKSGVAAARLLAGKGARVTLWDGTDKPEFKETCWDLIEEGHGYEAGQELPGDRFSGVVLSPGIPRGGVVAQKAMKQTDLLLGEVELASRWYSGKIIAITGTNGKSTTTQLVESILCEAGIRAVACGNIGHPFSTVVMEGDAEVAVIEVSSFQLESIVDFHPDVAVYLNLAADHLDRYPNLEAYGKAKQNLFKNQTKADLAVIQRGLEVRDLKAREIRFSSSHEGADLVLREGKIMRHGEFILNLSSTSLVGPHNAENIMAAVTAVEGFGVSGEIVISALQKYKPLPHRLEFVDCIEGVQFINDSKATNPDALMRALQGIDVPAVLIAGGKNKGFNFRPLAGVVGETCHRVILMGESGGELSQAWGGWVNCEVVASMEEAVQSAFANRSGIKTVLLSPGCASFDMFKNFEDRGERFKESVRALKNQQQGEKNE